MNRRPRTVATLVALIGMFGATSAVQVTSASWTGSGNFEAEVSSGQWGTTTTTSTTTTTTTTLPPTTTTIPPTTTTIPPTTSTTPPVTTTTLPPTTTTTTTTLPPTTTTSSTSTTTTTTTTTLPPTTTTTQPPTPPSQSSGGISAANPNTVIKNIDWNITGAKQVCTELQVTGVAADARHWAVRVNLAQAPWYGTPANQINLNGSGTLTTENAQSVLITGRTHKGGFDPRSNNTPLTNTQTALITICSYNAPVPPPADPSWYTVTTTPGTWTDTQACVNIIVATTRTNLSTSPFFYGWTTTVDLTAAKARITGAGKTLNYVGWTPFPDGDGFVASPSSYNPPQDQYTITSRYALSLRPVGGGADSRTLTVCVYGY